MDPFTERTLSEVLCAHILSNIEAQGALNSSSEPNLSGNLRSFHSSWRYDGVLTCMGSLRHL